MSFRSSILLSSLPLLADLHLEEFTLSTDSIKNLVHLSSLEFIRCGIPDLSFLTQDNSLPELRTLRIDDSGGDGLSASSFASLSHAPDLHLLAVNSDEFDNGCLKYLENMVHLRKLDLSDSNIVGDSRSLKVLMQNLVQLEELNLQSCYVGSEDAVSESFYSPVCQLRVLNMNYCALVDDDLNGIGALKNTLEVLNLGFNDELTNEALVHLKDLVKLKKLNLKYCDGIDDLSPLKGCFNLEDLDVSLCEGLTDDSFRVFSDEPNSFPSLRILNLEYCEKLSEKVFEHLSKNNHLVCQLKELSVGGMSEIVAQSSAARNHIYHLKGLRSLKGILDSISSESDENDLKGELMRSLKNLEEVD